MVTLESHIPTSTASRLLLVKTNAQKLTAADRLIYLGPWCQGAHQNQGQFKTLPHHLDNLDRVNELENLSESLFDHYLPQLSSQLNAMHGVNWSDRAWTILIGPWLSVFLDVVVDRFETIHQLNHQTSEIHTYTTSYPCGSWTPTDTREFVSLAVYSDQFNEFLFSRIINESTGHSILSVENIEDFQLPTPQQHSRTAKTRIIEILGRICSRFSKSVVFVDSYFNTSDRIILELKLGQIPTPPPPEIRFANQAVDGAKRDSLKVRARSPDSLNAIVCKLLPDLLPKAYLEDFKSYKNAVALNYPLRTRIIVTAHAYSYNEGFRFWAASQVSNGAKLLCVQHGGGYGVGLRWAALQHELRVADLYCTSGWVSKTASCTVPMPVPKLAKNHKLYVADNLGTVLWIWKAIRAYSFRLSDGSINRDIAEYLDGQRRFGNALENRIKKRTKIRLYPPNSVWGEQLTARNEFPDMVIDEGRTSFPRAARNTRIWIVTYNSTTLLEAMVSNVPFIAFWNPGHCSSRLSEDAIPIFDQMRRCGIFHESPDSAAEMVNEHFEDTARWWASEDIQQIRLQFCENFAVTRKNWLDIWAGKLREVLNG